MNEKTKAETGAVTCPKSHSFICGKAGVWTQPVPAPGYGCSASGPCWLWPAVSGTERRWNHQEVQENLKEQTWQVERGTRRGQGLECGAGVGGSPSLCTHSQGTRFRSQLCRSLAVFPQADCLPWPCLSFPIRTMETEAIRSTSPGVEGKIKRTHLRWIHGWQRPWGTETTTFLPSWRQSKGGPGGKVHPLPIKYKFRLLISGKKSTPAVSTGAWGRKRGRNWGCLRNVCVYSRGENVSASSDGKKSLQDTGFPVIIVFCFLFNFFFHVRDSGIWIFFQPNNDFFFSITDLSSGFDGQFINLNFKRLLSHFICLLIYTFLYIEIFLSLYI